MAVLFPQISDGIEFTMVVGEKTGHYKPPLKVEHCVCVRTGLPASRSLHETLLACLYFHLFYKKHSLLCCWKNA